MIVTSTGIVNGIIEDKYGKHGSQFNENGMPTYSLPLKIEDAPEGTKDVYKRQRLYRGWR